MWYCTVCTMHEQECIRNRQQCMHSPLPVVLCHMLGAANSLTSRCLRAVVDGFILAHTKVNRQVTDEHPSTTGLKPGCPAVGLLLWLTTVGGDEDEPKSFQILQNVSL